MVPLDYDMDGHNLSSKELERYRRQLHIPGFDENVQNRLRSCKCVILGAGGVGSPAAVYLAAAGVGNITIVDGDVVELSNLNRQIMFKEKDIGLKKAEILKERILDLNPNVKIEVFSTVAKEPELRSILNQIDLVLDTFDKNQSRLTVNKIAVQKRIPTIHAFSKEFCAELLGVIPYETACLHCVIDECYLEEDEVAVVGVSAGLTGLIMASMAIKHLTGIGKVSWGKRLIWDLLLENYIVSELQRDPRCPTCQESLVV